jgi:hypothetical protein
LESYIRFHGMLIRGGKEMTIHPEDVQVAKDRNILWTEETVMVTATERRVGPGGSLITPTTVVATDKRMIIINRATFGIRTDYEAIPYNRITSVRMEKGIISSSVFLRVSGYSSPGAGEQGFLKPGEQEGEISGLRQQDAKDLSDFIGKMIAGIDPNQMDFGPDQKPRVDDIVKESRERDNGDLAAGIAPQAGRKGSQAKKGADASGGGYIYCTQCGARNELGAKFCESCGAKLGK